MTATATILLVDDEPTSLNLLSYALKNQYDLRVATSGIKALKLAEQAPPDLILLDIMMPEIDGLETLRRLRQSNWGREIPVILVTADDRTETQVRGLNQGADDFITKPVALPVVQVRVRNALERRRLLSQLRIREEQYRRLSEDAPLCISTFLPDGTLTYVNAALAKLAHTAPETLLGQHFFDWLMPTEQEYIRQQLATLTPEQPLENHEQTYLDQDGQQRILQWTSRAFFDTADTLLFYQSVGIDITQRKRAEEQLQDRNQLLAALLQTSQSITGTTELQQILPMIVDNATQVMELDSGALYLLADPDTLHLAATIPELTHPSDPTLSILPLHDHPHVQSVIESGHSVLIPDTSEALLSPSEQRIIGLRNLGSILFLPIRLRQRGIGVLILASQTQNHAFPQDQITLLQGFADQAAHVIDNLRNYTAAQQYANQLERQLTEKAYFERALGGLNGDLAQLSGNTFYRGACRLLTEVLGTELAFVGRLQGQSEQVQVLDGWADGQPMPPTVYTLADSPCADIIAQGAACYPRDIQAQFPQDEWLVTMDVQAYVGQALVDKQGQPLGLLVTLGRRPLGDMLSRLAPELLGLFIDRINSEILRSDAEQGIRYQLQFQNIAAETATALAIARDETSVNQAIAHCLQRLGKLFMVDRCYLFQFADDITSMRNTHEWCATGITAQQDSIQHLWTDAMPWWKQRLLGCGMIHIPQVGALPPEAAAEQTEWQRQDIQSLVNIAMYGVHGTLTGFIGLDSVRSTRTWSSEELDMLRTIAGIVGSAIERRRAEEQLKLAASVFEHASEGITITDVQGTILDVNAAFTRITGYSREEVLGQNPRILNSGRQSQAFYAEMWHSLHTQGSWVGEIWNRRKDGEVYAELLTISTVYDADGQVQRYIALFSDVSAQKEHQRQLEQIAHYDALTGLPNRVLLADRLRQAMAQATRRGEKIALAYLDLDGFKAINDTYGHAAGDRLLVKIAGLIKRILRQGDTLARPGGDEFVVVLNDLPSIDACLPLLRRLLNTVIESADEAYQGVQVSASLGVSVYPQNESIDADQLLRQADQAMYQAKLAGKNRYHLFDAAHDRELRERHEDRKRIRQALAHQEFVLYYQPKVNMRHGTVIGAEALIRWQHPERGLLPPGAFLSLLDNHPLMIELGDWVIETALAQISTWRAAGIVLPVSVNVDALQLARADFMAKLQAALARHPEVQPSDLELEILETNTLQDIAQVSDILCAGQALGVSFALDDFGTGYSSLSYLKRLPVETLKIDQSFVRDMLDDPDDLAILEGIISLAEAFRRNVIAEGVETTAHGELLVQLGCELGQGYAIARPMPAAQIADWYAQWQPEAAWTKTQPITHHRLPILFATVEHRAWYMALWRYLNDEQTQPPPLNSHYDHFGKWLNAHTEQDDTATCTDIERLHDTIHCTAIELIELKQTHNAALALARFGEITTLHQTFVQALQRLVVGEQR